MCLSKLESDSDLLNVKEIVCWKTFSFIIKDNVTLLKNRDNDIITFNSWVKDPKSIDIECSGSKYPCGYHCFLEEGSAILLADTCNHFKDEFGLRTMRMTVRKVRLKSIVAVGLQGKHKSIVGREIFIEGG